MYLKEAVVGSLVWQGQDTDYVKRILEMPVARKTGIKILDDFNDNRTKKQIKETMFGVLEEMEEMKKMKNKEPVYLDGIKVVFARTMLNLDMDCEKEIKPVLQSIACGTIRHNTSLEIARRFNSKGDFDAVETLRPMFDITGGPRGFSTSTTSK